MKVGKPAFILLSLNWHGSSVLFWIFRYFLPITKYLAGETDTMSKNAERPGMLRIIAAVILGGITGTILFLIVALGIGAVNDKMGMKIPVNLLIAENVFSAILLILFILIFIAVFCWQVWNTPSSDSNRDFGPEE